MQTHRKSFGWVMAAAVAPVAALLVCTGCGGGAKAAYEPQPTDVRMPEERITNEQILDTNFTQQTRNAAVIDGIVYPYHFVTGDPELTLVGERHVNALLPRNTLEPLRIRVQRGPESDVLYEARLQTLLDRFAEAGYPKDQFVLVDELAGGAGILSERVLLIMSEEPRAKSTASGRQSTQEWGRNRGGGGGSGTSSGGSGGSGGGGGGGGGYGR